MKRELLFDYISEIGATERLKLSIVIPVFNNLGFTKSCINDLLKLKDGHEIIIVNNGSSDGTTQYLDNLSLNENNHHRFIHIKMKENTGFAKACNEGYEYATSEYVLFLNNDIKVKSNCENWTNDLITAVGDGLISPNGGIVDKEGNFITETDEVVAGNFYLSGWCLLGKKDTFNKLVNCTGNNYCNPFSEEFGIAYFEDTDLGLRAAQLNIPMIVQAVPVHHFGKQTSTKVGLSQLYMHAKPIFTAKWKGKLV